MSRNSSTARAHAARLLASLTAVAFVALAPFGAEAQMSMATHIPTSGDDIVVHPIEHATFAMTWGNHPVYVDPVGGGEAFQGLPAPHVILITDIHGDHLDVETLSAIAGNARIIAPAAVAEQLPEALKARTTVLANGESSGIMGMTFEAVPMYNTTADRLQYHSKGRGNGYIVTAGGARVYISGDTEDIPEMRALRDIDAAFVCFNLPYTMTEEQAASAVRAFRPDVVFPYHFGGSDPDKFASLVGDASDVRMLDWYPEAN